MTYSLRAICLSLLMFSASGVIASSQDIYPFEKPLQAQRFSSLTQEVRCLVCQNQSISDSNAPLANDMRRKVYDLMRSGQSDADIKRYLTDRYGNYVLLKPPIAKATWVLWGLPFVFILIAAGVLLIVVRGQYKEHTV